MDNKKFINTIIRTIFEHIGIFFVFINFNIENGNKNKLNTKNIGWLKIEKKENTKRDNKLNIFSLLKSM